MKINPESVEVMSRITGLNLEECSQILIQEKGDLKKAISIWKASNKPVVHNAEEKQVLGTFVHSKAKYGALVRLTYQNHSNINVENLKKLAENIAIQVAAKKPMYIDQSTIPDEELSEIETFFQLESGEQKKEENVRGFLKEVCLLEQDFVRNTDYTISTLIKECSVLEKTKIELDEFVRTELI